MSVISRIASQKRVSEQAKTDKRVSACIDMLADFYHKVYEDAGYVFAGIKPDPALEATLQKATDEEIGKCVDAILSCWQTESWTKQLVLSVRKRAAFKAYGDPMTLTQHQLKLRQHTTMYRNPLVVPINISPMGLPDENGNLIQQVVAGGLVRVPQCHIVGGKRSTLFCIAPQLQPVRIVDPELVTLDLTPQSYAEWVRYYSWSSSKCCNRAINWSDALQCLVCGKCTRVVAMSETVQR